MSELQITNAIEKTLIQGDLQSLNPDQRLNYYKNVCESLGLNPLTKPFDYIQLNGKLTLYAKRECTEQLRKIYNVSISIVGREKIGDVYVVTAQAKMPSGRCDESTGTVAVGKLQGDALANAYMKAETKAKRRVTLSLCGLGMLDETEVETIPSAKIVEDAPKPQAAIEPIKQEPAPIEAAKDPGDFICTMGTKYKGKPIKEIPKMEALSMLDWLKQRRSPTAESNELAYNLEAFYVQSGT